MGGFGSILRAAAGEGGALPVQAAADSAEPGRRGSASPSRAPARGQARSVFRRPRSDGAARSDGTVGSGGAVGRKSLGIAHHPQGGRTSTEPLAPPTVRALALYPGRRPPPCWPALPRSHQQPTPGLHDRLGLLRRLARKSAVPAAEEVTPHTRCATPSSLRRLPRRTASGRAGCSWPSGPPDDPALRPQPAQPRSSSDLRSGRSPTPRWRLNTQWKCCLRSVWRSSAHGAVAQCGPLADGSPSRRRAVVTASRHRGPHLHDLVGRRWQTYSR